MASTRGALAASTRLWYPRSYQGILLVGGSVAAALYVLHRTIRGRQADRQAWTRSDSTDSIRVGGRGDINCDRAGSASGELAHEGAGRMGASGPAVSACSARDERSGSPEADGHVEQQSKPSSTSTGSHKGRTGGGKKRAVSDFDRARRAMFRQGTAHGSASTADDDNCEDIGDEPVTARRLPDVLTVLVTTSPAASHPSTSLIERVLDSFAYAPGLSDCKLVVVCDGVKIRSGHYYRKGWVDEEKLAEYEGYKRALRELAQRGAGVWRRAEVLELEQNHGFGFAVAAGLRAVCSKYVCVVQHDRTFMRAVDLARVVRGMEQLGPARCGYVLLPTSSTAHYRARCASKLGQQGIRGPPSDVHAYAEVVRGSATADAPADTAARTYRFLPCVQWYDSTHVCLTAYYRNFVFGVQRENSELQLCRGGFIEDQFGQLQWKDICKHGLSAHAKWKTWLLDDGSDDRAVAHLNGRTLTHVHNARPAGPASAPPDE